MKLVDANLLLYAIDTASPHHAAARAWWDGQLANEEPLGLAWVTILAFLRLSTNPKVFRDPCTIAGAMQHVESWLARPSVRLVAATANHWRCLQGLLLAVGATGNLTTDAHLVALAIEHDCELCTTDGDFKRFPGLKWRNPLSGAQAGAGQ
ncbi:ribonuclease VapC [Verrucomicrobiota bacterium]|nr:ribonuclease VapC [Verrucomicrobiota bacterium]